MNTELIINDKIVGDENAIVSEHIKFQKLSTSADSDSMYYCYC